MKIQLENITKSYDNNKILSNINLTIYPHDFMIIYGESGCGKTTLLQIISGLSQADEGKILYNQSPISGDIQNYLSHHISYVFQDHKLLNEFNVRDNIMLGINLSAAEFDKEWYELLCNELKITHILDKQITNISIGQRQRVAIARALIKKPDVLFLDEPTGNLDKENTIYLFEFLKKIHKLYDLTIVMVTHETSLKKYGNRIIYISQKNIIEEDYTYTQMNDSHKEYKHVTHYLQILKFVEAYTRKHIFYYLFLSLCISICCISFFLSMNIGSNAKDIIYDVADHQDTSKIIQLDPIDSSHRIDIKHLDELKQLFYCDNIIYDLHRSYAFERSNNEKIIIRYQDQYISDSDRIVDFFKNKQDSKLIEGSMNISHNEIVIDNDIVKDLKINDPIGKHISIRLPIATYFKKSSYSENKTNISLSQERYIPHNKNIQIDFVIKGVIHNDFEDNYTLIHDETFIFDIIKQNAKKNLKQNEISSLTTSSAYFYLDSIDHLKEAVNYIENNYKNIKCQSKVIDLLECIENIDKVQSIYMIVNVFILFSIVGIIIVINILNYSKKQYFLSILRLEGLSSKEYKLFIFIESIYILIAIFLLSLIIIQLFLPLMNTLVANYNPIVSATEFVVETKISLFHIDYFQILLSILIGFFMIICMQLISTYIMKNKSLMDILSKEVN